MTLLPRIGIGHDTHRLEEGGPLLMGGILIDHDRHLIGHSDADVLFHALTDALLGALALGDIGDLFPDTDPQNRDRDSADFLQFALDKVASSGYAVGNIDLIVHAQRPKLGADKVRLRRHLARTLQVEQGVVSIKAKSGENVGPVGREEAIQVQCAVLLVPANT